MKWFFDIITVLGFFLTALGTYLTVKSGEALELIREPILTVSLIVMVLCLIGCYHYYHKSQIMASVMEGRNQMAPTIKKILEINQKYNGRTHVQHCISDLAEVCQEISAGMRKFHSPNISVCIQYVNQDTKGPYVNVLCRNLESKKRHESRPPSAGEKDYIDENTDFKKLLPLLSTSETKDIYYLNNFLPYSPFYRNSRFSDVKRKKYYGSGGWFHRIRSWELPYKSTLVVPLIIENSKERKVVGFLSIDSPALRSFSSKYDLPVIIYLAKMIAPFVEKYSQKNLL